MIHHDSSMILWYITSDTASDTSVDGILMLDADRWRTFRHTLLLLRPCVGHPWCPVDPVDPWPETWKTWHLADPGTYVGPFETSWIQRDERRQEIQGPSEVICHCQAMFDHIRIPSWWSGRHLPWKTHTAQPSKSFEASHARSAPSLPQASTRAAWRVTVQQYPRTILTVLYYTYYTQSSCQSSFSCLLSARSIAVAVSCGKHVSASAVVKSKIGTRWGSITSCCELRMPSLVWCFVEISQKQHFLILSGSNETQHTCVDMPWLTGPTGSSVVIGHDWSYLIIFVWICEKRLNYIKLITVTSLWRSDPEDGFACRSMISELTWQRHVPWVFSIQHHPL